MIDFSNIEYLKLGNARQKAFYKLLVKHNIFEKLSEFNPTLVGSVPIGIDIEGSDLDIICEWRGKMNFINTLKANFSSKHEFLYREVVKNEMETVICSFQIDNVKFEVFGQNRPIKEQQAYRHLLIEYRILMEKGEEFMGKIIELKKLGYKTEPAFAAILCIEGDSYQAILDLK